MEVQVPQRLAAIQEGQLDQHRHSHQVGTQPPQQPDRGGSGSPGGYHVVDQEDPITRSGRVDVYFQLVRAVLELVFLAVGVVRQLALLAEGNEPGPEGQGDRGASTKPRASIPAPVVTPASRNGAAINSTATLKAVGSASTGVMSLNTIPGVGNPATSRTRALSCAAFMG